MRKIELMSGKLKENNLIPCATAEAPSPANGTVKARPIVLNRLDLDAHPLPFYCSPDTGVKFLLDEFISLLMGRLNTCSNKLVDARR